MIKLGALGDVVQAFAPFAAIRRTHAQAHITLLTTAPFAALCAASPWFDAVAIDTRPPPWDLRGLLRLRRHLRGHDLVYDLQTSSRSSRYFLLAGRPPWSGIAPGCSLPHDNPGRDELHTRERQRDQLARAGIEHVPDPDLSWLATHGPVLQPPTALLVPGAAPHRPAKRWPVQHFGAIGRELVARGLRPVVIGAGADVPLGAAIVAACPQALDLTGRTTLTELGGLAARAMLAIGNDTGPMHLAAAMGCRSIVLFSGESDPALTAPRGRADRGPEQVSVLRASDLADLAVSRVAALLG